MSAGLRIAYLTAGSVGAGHVVRGLAVFRALERRGARGTFVLASPAGELPALASLGSGSGAPLKLAVRTIRVDSSRVTSPDDALASDAALLVRELDPDLLLVDLFWLPFLHVVRAARAPAWLLLRRAPPEWLVGPPTLRFDRSSFARVLFTEPCADGPVEGATRIEPIVVASRDERPAGPSLRERLGVAGARPLALVAHGGKVGEVHVLARLARERVGASHEVGIADLHAPAAPFPLAPWLPEADAIFGGAGYNLAWETVWLGLRDRATLAAFPRAIDDQRVRAAVTRTHRMRDNGADVLAADITG